MVNQIDLYPTRDFSASLQRDGPLRKFIPGGPLVSQQVLICNFPEQSSYVACEGIQWLLETSIALGLCSGAPGTTTPIASKQWPQWQSSKAWHGANWPDFSMGVYGSFSISQSCLCIVQTLSWQVGRRSRSRSRSCSVYSYYSYGSSWLRFQCSLQSKQRNCTTLFQWVSDWLWPA